jgi:hypothetical protein
MPEAKKSKNEKLSNFCFGELQKAVAGTECSAIIELKLEHGGIDASIRTAVRPASCKMEPWGMKLNGRMR